MMMADDNTPSPACTSKALDRIAKLLDIGLLALDSARPPATENSDALTLTPNYVKHPSMLRLGRVDVGTIEFRRRGATPLRRWPTMAEQMRLDAVRQYCESLDSSGVLYVVPISLTMDFGLCRLSGRRTASE